MLADILTILWKELREIFLQRGSMRGGIITLLIMIFVIGIFLPLQSGREWVESPIGLVAWSWLPLFLVMGTIADTIAGERERHTLETLLASRLFDRSILIGKMGASILYGWSVAVIAVLAGAVTVNISAHAGRILFYPLDMFAAVAVLSLLASALMASIGILVSLQAGTVRQAYQRMSIGFMALWFIPLIGIQFMPESWKQVISRSLVGIDPMQVILTATVILLAIDSALMAVGFYRFQRSRLELE